MKHGIMLNYQKPNQQTVPSITPEQLGLQFVPWFTEISDRVLWNHRADLKSSSLKELI
jgi:hypothetical protein